MLMSGIGAKRDYSSDGIGGKRVEKGLGSVCGRNQGGSEGVGRDSRDGNIARCIGLMNRCI